MHALKSFGLSAIILLIAALWMASGTLVMGGQGAGNGEKSIIGLIEGDQHGALTTALDEAGLLTSAHTAEEIELAKMTVAERLAQANGGADAAMSVRTQTFTLQQMPVEVTLRGRTKAAAHVTAAAETAGIVESINVSKGQRVEAGDLLCTLEQGTRQAAVAQAEAGLAQAEAGLAQAQLDHDTNASLRERGLAPANTASAVEAALASARAAVSSARAGLDNAQAELERTRILAKVGGLVEDPMASVGTMLNPGTACATIVQLDPIVFVGNVAEANIGLARTGLDARITTVTGQSIDGKVTFIAATADNATRSFPVEIEAENAGYAIRDGLTAQAVVNMGSLPGHLLPQSVLTLDDNGVLGVRSVKDNVVEFHPVTIVSDTRDGVWVAGLPASIDIITIGQEFVRAGQTVRASNDGAASDAAQASDESART